MNISELNPFLFIFFEVLHIWRVVETFLLFKIFQLIKMNRVSKIFQPISVIPKNAIVKNQDITSKSQRVNFKFKKK